MTSIPERKRHIWTNSQALLGFLGEQDHYAARMLKRYIGELRGAVLPLMPDSGPLTEHEIVVGFNRHSMKFPADDPAVDQAPRRTDRPVSRDDFGPEEFRIQTMGSRVVILGGSPRGVLYGIKGIFAEGNQAGWWGHRFFGEMAELRAYLLARLMWNPDLDWQQERRAFLEAYYGRQPGRVIERYLDDLAQTFAHHKVHSHGGSYDEGDNGGIASWATPTMISRWYSYMDEAESLATDAQSKRLVRIARLTIQRTELLITQDQTKHHQLMQAWLDESRSLGANDLLDFPSQGGTLLQKWAQENRLEWK